MDDNFETPHTRYSLDGELVEIEDIDALPAWVQRAYDLGEQMDEAILNTLVVAGDYVLRPYVAGECYPYFMDQSRAAMCVVLVDDVEFEFSRFAILASDIEDAENGIFDIPPVLKKDLAQRKLKLHRFYPE